MSDKQHTIKREATISGTGLHTGENVTLTFKPAPANHGYKFRRIDLPGQPVVKADVDYVVDISRGTTLEHNGVRINTVEHVLAALVGMEIDNVLIDLDGQELPIMDGSSRIFVDALSDAGLEEQKEDRMYFEIPENISYTDPKRNIEITAIPASEYQVTVLIDFNSPVLGCQHASVQHISDFKKEIAGSRTFCFLHELEELVDRNLIRGGDLSNAIVVVDKVVKNNELQRLTKLFNQPEVKVKEEGILNNVELRYQNEPARHKLLDVIGDLALIGTPIKGKIIASRPGHKANIEFAKKIKSYIKKSKTTPAIPKYDPNQAAVYDIKVIEQSLPHKYPFLLVDKIIEINENHVVGIKNVTYNEHFFQGHFPGNPVMPGVLQLEALAQAGGILVLNAVDNPQDYDTYFLKIDKAKFKQKVVPGDTLILKVELTGPVRRGICEMKGTAFVGNKIAAEAELVAQMVKKKIDK